MKRMLALLLLSAGLTGTLYSAPNAETLRAALPEGYELISVDPESVPLTGRVRDPEGQVLTAYLIKNPAGEWVASSNLHYYRSLDDVFVRSEQVCESKIEEIRQRELAREAQERSDQDIADRVVEELR